MLNFIVSGLLGSASMLACDEDGGICHFLGNTGYRVRLHCPTEVRLAIIPDLDGIVRIANDDGSVRCPIRIHEEDGVLCGEDSPGTVTFDCQAWPENPDVQALFGAKRRINFEFNAAFTEQDGTSWSGSAAATWRTNDSGCRPMSEDLRIEMSETPDPAQ